jgi:1-acyl-sn-glycerol-3-phosphate acyltransferase
MPNASGLAFLPPRLDQRVLAIARRLLPLWLRSHGLRRLEVEGLARLQEAMDDFQGGRCRLLLAFRHPSLDDPAVMAHLLWSDLARAGRPLGSRNGSGAVRPGARSAPAAGNSRRFRPHPHAQFLYDRGIPLWAGARIGWLLAHLGGCSIQRGGLDLPALRTARALLLDGPHPFAVAPEGATNGHNEVVSPLEPGVAQLALWTAEDLDRAGRPEATLILPVGLQYSYLGPVWPAIEALLGQLEAEAGLPPAADRSLQPERLYGRLLQLAERILERMERFYRGLHPQPLAPAAAGTIAAGSGRGPDHDASDLTERLEHLLEMALGMAERDLAVEPHGNRGERCRRLEQAGWERLYPSPGGPFGPSAAGGPSPLERSLAERLALETERSLWHMRLAESFVAVSGRYVRDQPSQERFADTLLILWDTLCRIRGRPIGPRPHLGPRRALIRIGAPLAVADRLAAYRADRRAAVADLTAALQQRLEGLIVPSAEAGPASGERDRP